MTAIGVLGPILLGGPVGPIRLGSVRQRRLLAALVAHLGAAVRTEQLAELVWDTDRGGAPADPVGAVQTNVARMRRLLPGEIRIVTTPEGYQLLADRGAVDVTAFADHLAAAATATDPQLRLPRLATALVLWRGRPYAELDHPSLQPEVVRLTALRAGAAEQLATALLAAGRTGEAIAALEALTVAEPLREGAVAQLMRLWWRPGGRATRWPRSAGCAPDWPTSWAWTRPRSCGRSSSRCCVRRSPRVASAERALTPARLRSPSRNAGGGP